MVEQILFWIFALATCGAAIAVCISQNIVRMAFWLIISLGSTSGLFFLLGADFVGATQLLVYVGGTLVLLIFGVMLTASGPFIRIKTSPADGVVAAGVGAGFLALVLYTVVAVDWSQFAKWDKNSDNFLTRKEFPTRFDAGLFDSIDANADGRISRKEDDSYRASNAESLVENQYNLRQEGNTLRPIGLALLGLRPDKDLGKNTDSPGYLLRFEIVSVHLLVVLIGAAYLARAKRRVDSSNEPVSEAAPKE